ncbi:MAG: hypothetical protein E7222_04210 [Clostridiales bacterium]|nr:hypothetical protein [Clostridiales bacterium]
MAGDKLYLGNILNQLKQDTQDYSATLQTMITELRNVKEAVTANISYVNVRASDNLKASLQHSERSVTVKPGEVKEYPLLIAHCLARGVIRISFLFNTTSSIGNTDTYVSVNGRIIGTKGVKNGNTVKFDVPINAGEAFTIGVLANGDYTHKIGANSLKIYYDIVDIVNTGSVSIVDVF